MLNNPTVLETLEWTLLNSVIALVGYYVAAFTIDKPWMGRWRMQGSCTTGAATASDASCDQMESGRNSVSLPPLSLAASNGLRRGQRVLWGLRLLVQRVDHAGDVSLLPADLLRQHFLWPVGS